jgi:hypothetical protein
MPSAPDGKNLELAARPSIEAQAGRPFTDEEWSEARENLLAFARLVVEWKVEADRRSAPEPEAPEPDSARKRLASKQRSRAE